MIEQIVIAIIMALRRSQPQMPDESVVLASLRDYIEQLREEGLDGLPGRSRSAVVHESMESSPVFNSNQATERKERAVVEEQKLTRTSSPNPSAGGGRRTPVADARLPLPSAPGVVETHENGPARAELPTSQAYRYPDLQNAATLDALREFIGVCTRCKLAPGRTNLVFGVGNPNSQLMFVGEAPGEEEDLRGEPFVGRAGQLLTDIIEHGMEMSRDEVYICNVIKCRPPGNRNPEPDEVATCEPFLFRQIDLVRPQAIVGLGTFAVQALLKVKTPISKLRGIWHEVRGVKLMPTFHPAYLLRNPGDKRLVWSDIQQVMKLLGRPIPPKGARR